MSQLYGIVGFFSLAANGLRIKEVAEGNFLGNI